MLSAHHPFSPARLRLPYAWVIVLMGAVGVLLSAPGQTIGVSVFTDDLIAALGLSRLQLSVAYLLGTSSSAFLIPRAGRVIDVWGARVVAALACFVLGLSLCLNSRLGWLAHLLQPRLSAPVASAIMLVCMAMGFFLMRFAGQGVLTLASKTMVMRWFDRYRGRVMGLVGLCLGLLFSASPIAFEGLIRRFDWNGTWLLLGLLLVVVFTPLVLITFRDNPEECGLQLDALGLRVRKQEAQEAEISWSLRQARRTFTFWAFNLGFALLSLVITGWTFHVVSIFEEAGQDRVRAVAVFLPASVLGLVATLIGGWLLDLPQLRDHLHRFLAVQLLAVLGLGAGLLLLKQSVGYWLVLVGQGLASSLFGLLSAVVWPRYFGRQHLGAISGLNMAWMVFASALGPVVFAASKQWTGSYRVAIVACMLVAVTLLVASTRATRPDTDSAVDPQ